MFSFLVHPTVRYGNLALMVGSLFSLLHCCDWPAMCIWILSALARPLVTVLDQCAPSLGYAVLGLGCQGPASPSSIPPYPTSSKHELHYLSDVIRI